MNSGFIIAIAIIGAFLAGGYYLYSNIKNHVEQFSSAAFGTKSIVEGLERQADMLAETPKSVSGMTRIFEPQIRRDFPDFNLAEFKNKVENSLTLSLQAITEENQDLLQDVSKDLRLQVENRIKDNQTAQVKEHYSQVKVHQTEITNYMKKAGTCVITFQSAVEHVHYKEKDGTILEGEKQRKEQTKYNTELLYIQDEKLVGASNAVGTTCPNCGAPVTKLGAMYCEYCGSAVTPVNIKVWMLHRIYQVDYHHV